MAEVTTSLNGNMVIANYDNSMVFMGYNTFKDESLKNTTGAAVTYKMGTLLGKAGASTHSGKVIVLDPAATDGSQLPNCILATDVTIAAGASANVSVCVKGDVDGTQIIFGSGVTLATIVTNKTIQDRLMSDTLGIMVRNVQQESRLDNQ